MNFTDRRIRTGVRSAVGKNSSGRWAGHVGCGRTKRFEEISYLKARWSQSTIDVRRRFSSEVRTASTSKATSITSGLSTIWERMITTESRSRMLKQIGSSTFNSHSITYCRAFKLSYRSANSFAEGELVTNFRLASTNSA